MRVKFIANVSNEDGQHDPGEYGELRVAIAREYIKSGWAIDPAGKIYRGADRQLIEEKAAVIETPEDHGVIQERETATLSHARRKRQ